MTPLPSAKLLPLLLFAATAGCGTFGPRADWPPVREVQVGGSDRSAADGYYGDAYRAILNRDYGRALDLLQLAKREHETDPRILNAFGVVYDKLGRFDLSARYYAEALAADPQSWIVHRNQSYSQELQRQWVGRSETEIADARAPMAATGGAAAPVAAVTVPAAPAPAVAMPAQASAGGAPPTVAASPASSAAVTAASSPAPAPRAVAPPPAAAEATIVNRGSNRASVALVTTPAVKEPAARLVQTRSSSPGPRPYAAVFDAPSPPPATPTGAAAAPVDAHTAKAVARAAPAPSIAFPQARPEAASPPAPAKLSAAPPAPQAGRHTAAPSLAPAPWSTGPRPYAIAFQDLISPAPSAPKLAPAGAAAAPRHGPSVVLLDASGQLGRAMRLRDRLAQLGWSAAPNVRAVTPPSAQTVIRYPAWRARVAQALARTLPGGAVLQACERACSLIQVHLGTDIARWRLTPDTSKQLRKG